MPFKLFIFLPFSFYSAEPALNMILKIAYKSMISPKYFTTNSDTIDAAKYVRRIKNLYYLMEKAVTKSFLIMQTDIIQREDRKRDVLHMAGVPDSQIYMDKLSGKDFNRPQYQRLLSRIDKDSVLCIHN